MACSSALVAAHDLWSASESDKVGAAMPLDPRPACGGSAFQDVTTYPADDFIEPVTFKGAFGETNWLDGWSYVNTQAGFVSSSYACPDSEAKVVNLCGESAPLVLSEDMTLHPGESARFSFSETVPASAPPTYRGAAVKYSYRLTVGSQRLDSKTVSLLKVPIRVLR